MSPDLLSHILSFGSMVVGATWVLASRLGKIESAIKGHVSEDREKFESLGARVVRLESRRRR